MWQIYNIFSFLVFSKRMENSRKTFQSPTLPNCPTHPTLVQICIWWLPTFRCSQHIFIGVVFVDKHVFWTLNLGHPQRVLWTANSPLNYRYHNIRIPFHRISYRSVSHTAKRTLRRRARNMMGAQCGVVIDYRIDFKCDVISCFIHEILCLRKIAVISGCVCESTHSIAQKDDGNAMEMPTAANIRRKPPCVYI